MCVYLIKCCVTDIFKRHTCSNQSWTFNLSTLVASMSSKPFKFEKKYIVINSYWLYYFENKVSCMINRNILIITQRNNLCCTCLLYLCCFQVRQIYNQAGEISERAETQSESIRTGSQANYINIIETARSQGLARLYRSLNITDQVLISSFRYRDNSVHLHE